MIQMAEATRVALSQMGTQEARDVRREERVDEARMKMDVKPPRILCKSSDTILEEIEEFELRLCQYGLRTMKQHVQVFESCVPEDIVAWIRGQQERGPHAEEWRLCMAGEGTEGA